MELHITKVVTRSADKNGKAYISKAGKPYTRASIQAVEFGNEWLGGFGHSSLQEGAVVQAEVSEREYNGKVYKDFKLQKKEDISDVKIEKALNEIVGLKIAVRVLEEEVQRLTGGKKQRPAVDESAYTAFDDEGEEEARVDF